MRHRKRLIKIICSVAAAIFIAAAVFLLWRGGAFLPGWIEWNEKTLTAEYQAGIAGSEAVETDMSGEEATAAENRLSFCLSGKRVTVFSDAAFPLQKSDYSGELLWTSDREVLVQDMLVCDLNRDGADELILLCWKIGKYGSKVPRFEKEEYKWFQHIYIYEFRDGGIHPIWMASELGMDVRGIRFDSEKECLIITEKDGRETAWGWFSWGIEFVEEIKEKN